MKNARNWVNDNSQSGPFDLVSSCDEAAHIVATIQADVLRFAAAEIRRSGYNAEYVIENMAKGISRGFLPPNAGTQRPGTSDAQIANRGAMPGSLK